MPTPAEGSRNLRAIPGPLDRTGDRRHAGSSWSERRLAALVSVAVAALAVIDLGRRILANNDEARFAVLGQAVLARGEWLFPQINGAVYHAKPLLLAWLIALCSWPAGRVTQLTAVLPSALAAIATALVLYALGRSLWNSRAGRFAALVAATTEGIFLHARLPLPDMLMTLFITASLWMLWEMTRDRGGVYWLGFYGFMALAFWSKGPAGLLPLGIAAAHCLAARDAGCWRRLRLAPGLPLLVILVAPWWLVGFGSDAAAMRQVIVLDQLLWYLPQRITLGSLSAPVEHVSGILFPWVIALPAALYQAGRSLRERSADRQAVRLVLVWSAVTLAFVAASQMQRFRYYLPLVPPASLLIGWWWADPAPRQVGRALARLYAGAGGAFVVLMAAALATRGRWPAEVDLPSSLGQVAVLSAAVLTLVAVLVVGVRYRRLARVFPVAWAASALFLVAGYHWELVRHNAAYDYPRVRQEMSHRAGQAQLVASWGAYAIPLAFYFDRPVLAVDRDEDLRRATAGDPRRLAIVTDEALRRAGDRERLHILWRDRLALRGISVVGYSGDGPNPGAAASR